MGLQMIGCRRMFVSRGMIPGSGGRWDDDIVALGVTCFRMSCFALCCVRVSIACVGQMRGVRVS